MRRIATSALTFLVLAPAGEGGAMSPANSQVLLANVLHAREKLAA
jgi:hypothetical protein